MSAIVPAAAPAKSKKMLMLLVGTALAGVLVGASAGAWFVASRAPADDEDASRAAPVFLPMESMVVNLADSGGDRFAQIGVTLELENAKVQEQVRAYLPNIRSGVLMLASQRSTAELLQRAGKEKLAADILAEVTRTMDYPPPAESERAQADVPEDAAEHAPARRRTQRNPVRRVLFSSFIVQ
nr:flagellar basal body-associated FliL family protein [Verminephrobacter aporrectodeae]